MCTRDSLLACSLLLIASKALSPFYRAAERRLLPGTLGTLGNEVGKEIFKQTPPSLRHHKRGGMEPKVGSKDVASLHEGSPNSFHGQLQLAFMPRFAYRSKIISRTLSLIFVSDVSAGWQEILAGARNTFRRKWSRRMATTWKNYLRERERMIKYLFNVSLERFIVLFNLKFETKVKKVLF